MNSNQKRMVTLVKNGEKYVFSYNESNRDALLETFGRFAADSQLNFSWHDAAVMANKTSKNQNVLLRPMVDRSGNTSRPDSTSTA